MPWNYSYMYLYSFVVFFASTKDKFGSFIKKLFHFSTLHTYHRNSSWAIRQARNYLWLQLTRWQFPIINCLDINCFSLFMTDLIIPNNLSFNNFRTKTTRSWEIPRNEYTVQILVIFPSRKLQQENVWRIQKHSMGGRKTRIPVSFLKINNCKTYFSYISL